METVGRRLKKLIESEATTLQEFCDKFGFVYNSIQPITKDKRELGINIVKELAQHIPDLNTHWLLFGEGKMKFSFYDENDKRNEVAEPGNPDLMEGVLIKYLSSEKVKEKIGEIVREKLIEIQLALQPENKDPELAEKLSKIIEKDPASQKPGNIKY